MRGDLIQAYKIFNNFDDLDKTQFFADTHANIVTRNSTNKIHKQHYNCKLRKHVFSYRVTNNWNNIATNVKRAPNVNNFKKQIDDHNIIKNNIYDFDGQQ